MSKVLAPLFRIEERALSIGLGLKRTSQCQVSFPQFHRFQKALLRGQLAPFGPFVFRFVVRTGFLHDDDHIGFLGNAPEWGPSSAKNAPKQSRRTSVQGKRRLTCIRLSWPLPWYTFRELLYNTTSPMLLILK